VGRPTPGGTIVLQDAERHLLKGTHQDRAISKASYEDRNTLFTTVLTTATTTVIEEMEAEEPNTRRTEPIGF
jgi:hypothetical protein